MSNNAMQYSKCHFKLVFNAELNAECNFPKTPPKIFTLTSSIK